eukprot:205648-Pyramimonas_sp.AAC.1
MPGGMGACPDTHTHSKCPPSSPLLGHARQRAPIHAFIIRSLPPLPSDRPTRARSHAHGRHSGHAIST